MTHDDKVITSIIVIAVLAFIVVKSLMPWNVIFVKTQNTLSGSTQEGS